MTMNVAYEDVVLIQTSASSSEIKIKLKLLFEWLLISFC